MVEIEQLQVVIDLIDSFSAELDSLLAKLTQVELAIDRVDGRRIDLDTKQAQASLATLQSQMAGMQAQTALSGGGSSNFGAAGGGGMGAGVANAADEAADGLFEMDLRMESVHNALAKMVPLILVVIGALPAMIGGLVAVAGAALAAAAALTALTAFAGLGAAMARGDGDIMSGLMDIFEQIQEDFMDAFRPLAERLSGFFEDALDGLDKLFQAIADEGDSLVALTEQAREFGGWVLSTLPSFLRELAQFADAADEALGVIVSGIGNLDFFGIMADMLADTLPMLVQFGSEITKLLGHLFQLSLGFFAVTNGILAALNIFLDLISHIPGGLSVLGTLVGMILAVWTATMILNSSLVALATKTLAKVGQAIITYTVQLFGTKAASITATLATYGLANAMRALAGAIALTGIGALLVIFGGIAGNAAMASNEIDKATNSLKEFANQRDSMTDGENPYAQPSIGRGDNLGTSRFSGGNVTINVEGDADRNTLREQSHNAMYRLERPRRGQ